MAITLVGQAGTGGDPFFSSPGPVISYSSVNGNTLVVTGQMATTGTSPGISGITSISDSAGNDWQYATSSNQNPPSVVTETSYWFCSFVGWCLDAAAVTSVTLTGDVGNTALWIVSVSEWHGIAAADSGVALTGTNANPSGTVDLAYPGELVVGSLDSSSVNPSALPSGWTAFGYLPPPPTLIGYAIAGTSGYYMSEWAMASDTYTLALMSFSSTGATAPPVPSMRAF